MGQTEPINSDNWNYGNYNAGEIRQDLVTYGNYGNYNRRDPEKYCSAEHYVIA